MQAFVPSTRLSQSLTAAFAPSHYTVGIVARPMRGLRGKAAHAPAHEHDVAQLLVWLCCPRSMAAETYPLAC